MARLHLLVLARFTTIGLTLILAMLALSAFWGIATTRTAEVQAERSILHNTLYQDARHALSQEIALQHDYWLQPQPQIRVAFDRTARQLAGKLHRLQVVGEDDDRQFATAMLAHHARYVAAVRLLFRAVDQGHMPQARTIDDTTIDPLFGALDAAINRAADAEARGVTDNLRQLDGTTTIVGITIAIVFTVALALIVIFGIILSSYRRSIDAAARAEMARLAQAALTDHLTGLGNHRAFQEDIQRAVARARREGSPVTLALIDLDDFKVINDQHGHAHGDRVLQEIGAILRGGRATDRAFRLGGDEFALIMPATPNEAAMDALERIRQNAAERLFGGTISTGVATLDGGGDGDILREQADAALYEAKRRGRNTVVSFDDIAESAAIVSSAKILAVRRLIAEQGVKVAFQPIWNPEQGRLVAFEALARPLPEYGLSSPLDTFDIADRIGRAPELDAVCRRAILQRARELPPDTQLFVNLSPQSLDHETLAGDRLLRDVEAAGLCPERIVLEITERSLTRPGTIIREARRLRGLGFRIALDDVGAGNAGLEMLRQVHVDYVKIDRAVIANAITDVTARSVLAAIIAFAREANTLVIAEGIETRAMLDLVRQAMTVDPCMYGVQGYLLGRPSETIPDPGTIAHLATSLDAA